MRRAILVLVLILVGALSQHNRVWANSPPDPAEASVLLPYRYGRVILDGLAENMAEH